MCVCTFVCILQRIRLHRRRPITFGNVLGFLSVRHQVLFTYINRFWNSFRSLFLEDGGSVPLDAFRSRNAYDRMLRMRRCHTWGNISHTSTGVNRSTSSAGTKTAVCASTNWPWSQHNKLHAWCLLERRTITNERAQSVSFPRRDTCTVFLASVQFQFSYRCYCPLVPDSTTCFV